MIVVKIYSQVTKRVTKRKGLSTAKLHSQNYNNYLGYKQFTFFGQSAIETLGIIYGSC